MLKLAGVPASVYQPVLGERDEATGKFLPKRKTAPLISNDVQKTRT